MVDPQLDDRDAVAQSDSCEVKPVERTADAASCSRDTKCRVVIKCKGSRAHAAEASGNRRNVLRDVSNRFSVSASSKSAQKQDPEAGPPSSVKEQGASCQDATQATVDAKVPFALDDLPEVVICRIASFADCLGTARLCVTNKFLHRILRDAVHVAPRLHLPTSPFYFAERLYVPIPSPFALSCMDVNAKHNGTSALQRAIQLKHWGMIHVLLKDHRIDPSLMMDSPNAQGVVITRSAEKIFLPTKLHRACWEGRHDPNWYLKVNLNPDSDSNSKYLKSQTSPSLYVLAALCGNRAWLKSLLGLKVTKRHHWVEAMVWAVRRGNLETVQLLLDLHKDSHGPAEQKAEFEDLALFSAVEAGQRAIVHALLADIGRLKYTPACYTPEAFKYHLHAAAAQGFDDILEDLLDASKFHPDSYMNGGQRLLDAALFYGRLSTVKLLLRRGSKILQGKCSDSLWRPIHTADIAMTELLLKNGADVNFYVEDCYLGRGVSYLQLALQYNGPRNKLIRLVKLLLKYKVDVNALFWREGVSALHMAVMAGDPLLVKLLLAHGANASAIDQVGHTPLQWAAYRGDLPCLQAMLAGIKPQDHWQHLKEVQLAINIAKKGLISNYYNFRWYYSQGLTAVQLLKDHEINVRERIKAELATNPAAIGKRRFNSSPYASPRPRTSASTPKKRLS